MCPVRTREKWSGRLDSTSDPLRPWQRGSNENANRLLRQYLAKRTDLRRFSLRDLDDIARRINTRPRRVLDWATSAELFWPHVHAEYVPLADRRPGDTTEPHIMYS
jgi:hypothetical protein